MQENLARLVENEDVNSPVKGVIRMNFGPLGLPDDLIASINDCEPLFRLV